MKPLTPSEIWSAVAADLPSSAPKLATDLPASGPEPIQAEAATASEPGMPIQPATAPAIAPAPELTVVVEVEPAAAEKSFEIAVASDATDAPPGDGTSAPSAVEKIAAILAKASSSKSLGAAMKKLQALDGINEFVTSKKHGRSYAVLRTRGYPEVLAIASPELNHRIRANARKHGSALKQIELDNLNAELLSQAEEFGITLDLYPRVAPLKDGGVEIDLCDGKGSTVRLTALGVEVMPGTSATLFVRTASALALPVPAADGDYALLGKYVNLAELDFLLYIGVVTFTIASPKIESTKYLFLVLKGTQGSGKTFASKTTKGVIDPNTVSAQTLPGSPRDLAIMLQSSHLLVVDNLRDLTTALSDTLCIAATGGAVPMRKLYSDDEQKALFLHGAILFNGIHPFIGQSDFADRCLVLDLMPIAPAGRKSEAHMLAELESDRPVILRGLYDVIVKILQRLPDAEPVAPSRMIDFCRWLAAMESALEMPEGTLQNLYAASIKDAQLESLLDNPLAVTIIEFADTMKTPEWVGTPTEFYAQLTIIAEFSAQRSRVWPSSAAVLSKRLHGLQAPLLAQGISIDWTRGKDRQIVVRRIQGD